jgi:hypothetical protein
MNNPPNPLNRRTFLKQTALAAASVGALGLGARSQAAIPGANDRVRVGVVGFSDRFRSTLLPCFKAHCGELNFDIVAVSDLWSVRREEGRQVLEKTFGHPVTACRNNEELYESVKDLDAVILSTADFQHALHTVEAVKAGKDVYAEKPLAETMADNRAVLKAVRESKRIVQIGSQRRSGPNYLLLQRGNARPGKECDLTRRRIGGEIREGDEHAAQPAARHETQGHQGGDGIQHGRRRPDLGAHAQLDGMHPQSQGAERAH